MRIAIGQYMALDEHALRFSGQIGACGVVVNTPALGGHHGRDHATGYLQGLLSAVDYRRTVYR